MAFDNIHSPLSNKDTNGRRCVLWQILWRGLSLLRLVSGRFDTCPASMLCYFYCMILVMPTTAECYGCVMLLYMPEHKPTQTQITRCFATSIATGVFHLVKQT